MEELPNCRHLGDNRPTRGFPRELHPPAVVIPCGHSGATLTSSAAGSTPTASSSDNSLLGPGAALRPLDEHRGTRDVGASVSGHGLGGPGLKRSAASWRVEILYGLAASWRPGHRAEFS
jgi:hypothetical protein